MTWSGDTNDARLLGTIRCSFGFVENARTYWAVYDPQKLKSLRTDRRHKADGFRIARHLSGAF